MSINMIVAVEDGTGLIGINGKLANRDIVDLRNFRAITDNNIVIMGSATMNELELPLANRHNMVVSKVIFDDCVNRNKLDLRTDDLSIDVIEENGFYICRSLESVILNANLRAKKTNQKIFIIGGQTLYDQMYKYIDILYLTIIEPNKKQASLNNIKITSGRKFNYFQMVSTAIKTKYSWWWHNLFNYDNIVKYFDDCKVLSRRKVVTNTNTLYFLEIDCRYKNRMYCEDLTILLKAATRVTNGDKI